MQCTHFSRTSLLAKRGQEYLGFVSAYLIPNRADTLFVWQVVVSSNARGQGLGSNMLATLLAADSCKKVRYLETTITQSNPASWSLFRRLAERLDAQTEESVCFDRTEHFMGTHDTEYLLRIGPFSYSKKSQS